MTEGKEFQVAFRVAVVLFIVGILSYTAFSANEPEQPIRRMYQSVGGKVLFTHQNHVGEYGLSCKDCHHHPQEEEDADTRSCSACHTLPADGTAPKSCLDCHEADEIEVDALVKRSDAFHTQCIGCHKENEAGPVLCASCHVK